MTTIPAAGYFNDVARTNSEAKDGQDDILAVLREIPGGAAETALTIAAGSVTPTGAAHAIDTESAASTDDLANLAQTNHPDGRWLLLRAADGTRDVVVKHQAGGAGQISLAAAADFTLDATDKWLLVKRNGTLWEEVLRGFGADAAAERAFLGLTYASQAEAEAGVATGKAMDPLLTKQAIAAQAGGFPAADFTSAERTVATGAVVTVAHSLAAKPRLTIVELLCKTTEGGYAVGEAVIMPAAHGDGVNQGVLYTVSATEIKIIQGNNIVLKNQSTFADFAATVGNWKWIVRCFL